jgi:antitoxin component YwqK of YwqJK toxin-antitoxin module
MKYIWIVLCAALLWSCSEENKAKPESEEKSKSESKTPETELNPEDLVELKGNLFTEYYDAAKTKIKFQGEHDENGKRHGKWVHYHKNGTEASITFYTNGIRNGFSSVKRPNGAMYYHGEYKDDKPVGVWKYYDEKGVFSHEKDYGTR